MIELDANDLAASLNDAKSQMKPTKEELLHIMEPFLSDRLEQKRSVELTDIAKLVLIRGANLESMMESPDFVIAEAGEKIGVEIRQLVTKKIEYNRYIQKLFDRASGMYKE